MKKKSSILKNTFVLFIVTLVAVALLAVVNQMTQEPIQQAEINARAEAYETVYPNASGFAEIENTDVLLAESSEILENAGYAGCTVDDVLAVTDGSGETIGYVMSATSPSGYGGDIQIAVGISSNNGSIQGFTVLSNSETAGLGSKCTEPDFTDQFAGKSAAVLSYTKTGAASEDEIDAISGATITTNAVTEAVNSAIIFYQTNFIAAGLVTEEASEETVSAQSAYPDAAAVADYDFSADSTEYDNEEFTVDTVQQALDEKEQQIGYIITVTAHNGYGGDLQIALGIGNDEIIKGFSVLLSNETESLGGKCTSSEFAEQFSGLAAAEVKYVPSGANPNDNEIDAISSATVTTDAVLTAVNGAIDIYHTYNTQLKGD